MIRTEHFLKTAIVIKLKTGFSFDSSFINTYICLI